MKLDEMTEKLAAEPVTVLCDRCENGVLSERPIKTAFWQGQGLLVIRNIPAMVCPICGEDYVSEQTAIALDRMRGAEFPTTGLIDRMIVPVLDFAALGPAE